MIYFGYGIRNSKENVRNDRQNFIFPCFETNFEAEPTKNSEPAQLSTLF